MGFDFLEEGVGEDVARVLSEEEGGAEGFLVVLVRHLCVCVCAC